VLEDRRRNLLRDLASRTAGARTEDEVWRVSAETIGENCLSLPFAFLYQYRPSEHQAYLAGASVETDEARFLFPSASGIPALGFRRIWRNRYSTRSLPPNSTAPAWGFASAGQSLSPMVGACGRSVPLDAVQLFT